MDWFERLTGFAETEYYATRARLAVENRELVSRVTGNRYGIGELELASLQQLRDRAVRLPGQPGRLRVQTICGDVRGLHQRPEFASALFQVASQFNLLEMLTDDATGPVRPKVSQAFCAALPVAYTDIPAARWESFARLVLDAAYEATLLAGVLHAPRGGSNVVLLTRLGGGAFGNQDHWIDLAMRRALDRMRNYELDVRIVSRGMPCAGALEIERDFS